MLTRFKVSFYLVLISMLSLFVVSCVDEAGNPVNIALVEIRTPTGTVYKLGEPIEITFSIAGQNVDELNIPVIFYMVPDDKLQELTTNEDAETYDLGVYVLTKVTDGVVSHTASLTVPDDIPRGGIYHIVANVDPGGAVEGDTNTADNFSRGTEQGSHATFAHVTVVAESFHDYVLNEAVVGSGFFLIPEPTPEVDENETTAPDTKVSDIVGFVYATYYGHKAEAAQVTAAFLIDGTYYPTHFWDPISRVYEDAHDILFTYSGERHYFGYDIALNGQLRHLLHANFLAGNTTVIIRFSIRDISGHIEQSDANNQIEISVPYYFYAPEQDEVMHDLPPDPTVQTKSVVTNAISVSKSFSASYDKSYGDSDYIALNLDFSSVNTVSSSKYTAYFKTTGDMSFDIFNNNAEIFSTSALLFAYGTTGYAGYAVGVSVLGNTLIDESNNTYDALSGSWDRSWDEDTELFSSTFTVVIVPVTVEVGIAGSMGFGAELELADAVATATGTLFEAGLDATASASIDLAIASGGVEADFTIIEDSLTLTGEADLSQAASQSQITLSATLANELKAIEGEIFVFVKYPKYKWCCKIETKEYDYTIYNTDALYDKTWTFLNKSTTISF